MNLKRLDINSFNPFTKSLCVESLIVKILLFENFDKIFSQSKLIFPSCFQVRFHLYENF